MKNAGTAMSGLGGVAADTEQKIGRTASSVIKLKTAFIDGYGASYKMEQAIRQANRALDQGKLSADEYGRVLDGIKRKYDAINSTKLSPANMNGPAGVGAGNFNSANVAAQFQDIAVTAAMGMSPLQIALQQGTQIAGALGSTGAAGAVATLGAAFTSLISPVSLAAIGLTAAAAAAIQYGSSILSMGQDSEETLAKQRDLIDQVARKWGDTLPTIKAINEELNKSRDATERADATAAAISMTWEGARGAVGAMNIEITDAIARLQAAGASADDILTLQNAWASLSERVATGKASIEDARNAQTTLNLVLQQNGLPIITSITEAWRGLAGAIGEASGQTRRLQSDLSGNGLDDYVKRLEAGRAQTEALLKLQKVYRDQYNPAPSGAIPIPTPRPLRELEGDGETKKTESAYQSLIQSANQRIAQIQNEISLVGQSASAQARLRAEFEAEAQYREQIARNGQQFNQQELDALKQKAAAYADLNSQLASMKALQSQQDSIKSLQLEAQLIGASARERATATAALQAEMQLRQQGVDLGSREAQQYVANAQAMAQWKLEIEQMSAGWSKVQDAGMSAIDSLTGALTGETSWKDAGKQMLQSILKPMNEMAIANPLKNAIYGTNLPTIDSIGGFGGFLGALTGQKPGNVPGMPSATASMMVTAGTVMINGGVSGGLGGLASVIGGTSLPSVPGGLAGVIGGSSLPSAGATRTGLPLSTITAANGLTADVNSQYAGNFQGFINELSASGYNISSLGGYNYRNIRGTNTLSNHAFGNAIDINPMANPDTGRGGPLITDMPSNVSSMAARWGLNWGGDWQSKKDAMHFEVAKGAQPVGIDQSMSAVATSAQAASKNIADLGQSSTSAGQSLMNAFSPTASSGTGLSGLLGGGQLPSNYFPDAPSAPTGGGFNPLSLITGLFGLFGFADGTDFSPGGIAMVGERGPEIVRMPRGSQVIPNHKLNQFGGGGGVTQAQHTYSITVAGSGDKELMANMRKAAEESVKAGLKTYDRRSLPARIQRIQDDPYSAG